MTEVKTKNLYSYQEEGIPWLVAHRHALLADEMGLGKTVQAIRAADSLKLERILVVGPAVARATWKDEFSTWSICPRKVTALYSKDDFPPADGVVICSFEYASKYSERLSGPWEALIVDEAHLLTSVEAKRSAAVWGRKGGKMGPAGGLVHRSNRVWLLSGTPAPNHWGELWIMLFTFGVTKLDRNKFLLEFCHCEVTNEGIRVLKGRSEKAAELRAMLAPLMLRRKKMDVLKELPPITYQDVQVEAGSIDFETDASLVQYIMGEDRRADFYAQVAKEKALVESVIDVTGLGRDGVDALSAVSGSTATYRRYTGMLKLESAAALIESELTANAYEKVVVFAIHQGVIEGLRVKLAKFGAVTLYGKTPPEKRDWNVKKFQTTKKCRVFIGNIKAAGTNITLTAAHHVIFVEQEWAPGHNAQAAMRCHRIGQKEPVFVRFLALENSIDEQIARVLKRKTRDATQVFG